MLEFSHDDFRQLAEQYGDEVASDVLSRSRNKMNSFHSGMGTAPSSPITSSGGLPAQGRATGVDSRGYAQPQPGYGSAPPSSYPVPGGGAGRSTPPGATGSGAKRSSGYATYGSSAYQMSMLGKGAGEGDARI